MTAGARFHEISLATPDIRASVEFYQALGFTLVNTAEVLPYRYGVVAAGRLVLGLHENPGQAPGVAFVRPELARWADDLAARGLELGTRQTHPDTFNEITLDDPEGHRLWFIEAPVHAPVDPWSTTTAACGEFLHLGLPTRQPETMTRFWEQFGFVGLGESDTPYFHHALTSDHLNLALHAPRLLDAPLLVFHGGDARGLEALRAGLAPVSRPARGLPQDSSVFEAPEGTLLLALPADRI